MSSSQRKKITKEKKKDRLVKLVKKQIASPDYSRAKVIGSLAKTLKADVSFLPKVSKPKPSKIELTVKEFLKCINSYLKGNHEGSLRKLMSISSETGLVVPEEVKTKSWRLYIKYHKSRRTAYHEYLQSSQWQEIRDKLFEARGKQCNRCKSLQNIQVHHKTYDRLGQEKLTDLEVLCSACHQKEHGVLTNAA